MFKRLKKFLQYAPKSAIFLIFIFGLLAIPNATHAGYASHDKPAFDYNSTEDRKGATGGVVFNNFINTPSYGNERAFHTVRKTGNVGEVGQHARDVEVGDRLTLRAYIHNNANPGLNDDPSKGPGEFDGAGVAEDTRIAFLIPSGTSTNLRTISYLSTDASKVADGYKSIVTDTVDFSSDEPFQIDYIEGSARLNTAGHNGSLGWSGLPAGEEDDGIRLSDSIVQPGSDGRGGVLVSYDQVDSNGVPTGEWPGCFEFDGMVLIDVQIVAPDVEFEKQVATVGQNGDWVETAYAQPGDVVAWYLEYRNEADGVADGVAQNVRIRDHLPPYLELIPGSVKVVDAARPQGEQLSDEGLFSANGVLLGSYLPGANGYIQYQTRVLDDFRACEASLPNTMYINVDGYNELFDQAKVIVTKEDCSFSCELLEKTEVSEDRYKFTMKAKVNETALQRFEIDFGDGETASINEGIQVEGDMYTAMIEHEYAQAGNYDVMLRVVTTDGVATNDQKCVETVTVAGEPETPAELPNTGPGAAALGIATLIPGAQLFIRSRQKLLGSLLNS